jgi:hypothetical protein
METATTPEASAAAGRIERQQHTASGQSTVVGGAGVYDQGGDEDEIVLVDAVQVEDDDLLNARVRVWWPSMQTWRTGDVIAYRQGPTEESLEQHYIPHDAHLIRYLEADGGGLRWHGFWEPDETFVIVDHPAPPLVQASVVDPNVFSTPPKTIEGSTPNNGPTTTGVEEAGVLIDEEDGGTRRKLKRTKGGAQPAIEYVMQSETLVRSRLLDYVPGVSREPSGERLPVAHRVERLQFHGNNISNAIPDRDSSARVLIALNIAMPDPRKACLVHGIMKDRKLSSVIPTFETLENIMNDGGIERNLVDTHFALPHPTLSSFAKITMAISGWRRSESFQFMGRSFLLTRENTWKGNVKAEAYHFEAFNQSGRFQEDFDAVLAYLREKVTQYKAARG